MCQRGQPLRNGELKELFEEAIKDTKWEIPLDFPDEDEVSKDVFYPDKCDIFKAFSLVGPADVNFVVLGQDPYYTCYKLNSDMPESEVPHATGIAFAVDSDCNNIPPSLSNIMKKVYDDGNGGHDLKDWIAAKRILLLNAALTVPKPQPGTDARKVAGRHLPLWKSFTTSILSQLRRRPLPPDHFVAWGCDARNILDDVFREFTWSYHPSVPFYGEENSFNSLWGKSIGKQMSMKTREK